MSIIVFTREDLEENRQGRITQAQRDRLADLRVLSMYTPGILFIVSNVIFHLALTDYSKYGEPARIVYIFLAIGLISISILFGIYTWFRIVPDLKGNNIKVVTGQPILGILYRGFGFYYGSSHGITVNTESFYLPREARKFIDERKIYRFYLTPKVKIILSVEEISDKIRPYRPRKQEH
jgi:hypothetical protein